LILSLTGGRLYSDICYSESCYSDKRYFNKCYFDWNARQQTRHYGLHSHSPGGDNYMCNDIRLCT